MTPAREEYTYVFRFTVEDGIPTVTMKVRGTEHGHPLVSSGLMLQTLLALSWYVENSVERQLDERLVLVLGRHLYRLLFGEPEDTDPTTAALFVERCYNETPVRISLEFAPAARRYAQLPWEFLAVPDPDSREGEDRYKHLAHVTQKVTLTRHTGMDLRLRRSSQLKVLVATHADSGQAEITTRTLEGRLAEIKSASGDRFDFRILRSKDATWPGIHEALNDQDFVPDVFHFSGHGEKDALWLAGQERDESLAALPKARVPLGFGVLPSADSFPSLQATIAGVAELFDRHRPQLVILDACSSDWSWLSEMLPAVAHQLVEYVPAVVAMRYPIRNTSAESFAATLYSKIADGVPLDEAVQDARYELLPRSIDDSARAFGTPVLYLRESERICDPLSMPVALGAQKPSDCPRCGDVEQWLAGGRKRCSKCKVPFRCGNPACRSHEQPGGGYNAKEIRDFDHDCDWCDWINPDELRPTQDQAPSLSQARAATMDAFGGVR